ncbi:hypothetical protein F2Q69_00006061 [Brassica cretica]|uniref:Uncharacterized protein n=1 Tax=Brassica cretica TaxID=69181 RepID=A0A8S9P0R5_BRACR|nr:hypothetical protein F2Q69_00006061 [Brassica cretica]
MNCARAGVGNQNGREIRTTSGTQNDHVLPPSSSHHHISLELHWMGDAPAGTKEAENNAIWSGVALDGRWTSWNKRGSKKCNLVIFTQNSLDDCSG